MERLSKKRKVKNLTLSETTIEYIEQYAAMHDMHFSRAIEALALMSIRDVRGLGFLAATEQIIIQSITRQYDRFAKLIVHACLEAGAARQIGESVYWLLMLQEASEYEYELKRGDTPTLSEMEDRLGVNPETPIGDILVTLFKKRRGSFRARSVGSLRRPIEEFGELQELFETWVAKKQESEDEL